MLNRLPKAGQKLSHREIEAMELVISGHETAKEVAKRLLPSERSGRISNRTAEIFLLHARIKLGGRNKTHAALIFDRMMRAAVDEGERLGINDLD